MTETHLRATLRGRIVVGRFADSTVFVHWSVLLWILFPLLGSRLLWLGVALCGSIILHETAKAVVFRYLCGERQSFVLWFMGAAFLPLDFPLVELKARTTPPMRYSLVLMSGPAVSLLLGGALMWSGLAVEGSILRSVALLNLGLAVLACLPVPLFTGYQLLVFLIANPQWRMNIVNGVIATLVMLGSIGLIARALELPVPVLARYFWVLLGIGWAAWSTTSRFDSERWWNQTLQAERHAYGCERESHPAPQSPGA